MCMYIYISQCTARPGSVGSCQSFPNRSEQHAGGVGQKLRITKQKTVRRQAGTNADAFVVSFNRVTIMVAQQALACPDGQKAV